MTAAVARQKPTPAPGAALRRHRWVDLGVGILLGIVLGLCVIVGFVFLGSEGSIDAPRITSVDTGFPLQRAATIKATKRERGVRLGRSER
jgi:hypothetical protein